MSGRAYLLPSSPISKLNTDILWTIFNYNSHVNFYKETEYKASRPPDEPETSGLLDNRSCSQVCRSWRDLILSSPSIWANSLDLDYLNQPDPKDRWRNVVLARTGSAPLTVVGETSPSVEAPNTRFVFFILEHHLHRVKKLSLYPAIGSGYSDYDEYERRLCIAMNSPAPHMEHLSLSARPWATNWENDNAISLHALTSIATRPTRLRHVHVDGFRLNLCSGYLSSITDLHLVDVRTLSTFALFNALREMPLLQTIKLQLMRDSTVILPEDGFDMTVSNPVLPTVSLPCLHQITLCTGFHLMQDVIAHLVPSTACSVRFLHYIDNVYPEETSHPAFPKTEIERVQFGRALAQYLTRQILAEKEDVILEIMIMEVEVPCKYYEDEDDIEGSVDNPDTSVTVCLRIGPAHHPPETRRTVFEFTDVDVIDYIFDLEIDWMFTITDGVLSGLSYTDLTKVIALDLCSFWTYLLNPHCPIMQRLLGSLKNVTTIYAHDEGLSFLNEANTSLTDNQQNPPIILCNNEWGNPPDDEAFSYFERSKARVLNTNWD